MVNALENLSGTVYLIASDLFPLTLDSVEEEDSSLEWKNNYSGQECFARAYISMLLSPEETIETKYLMVEINPDIDPKIKELVRKEYLMKGAVVSEAVEFNPLPFEPSYVQRMLGAFNAAFAESTDKYQATE
jgi:hypothetical protein